MSLVEKVARIIAEYPDEWLWADANASQRSHYETLAMLAINAVRAADAAAASPPTKAQLDAVIGAARAMRAVVLETRYGDGRSWDVTYESPRELGDDEARKLIAAYERATEEPARHAG